MSIGEDLMSTAVDVMADLDPKLQEAVKALEKAGLVVLLRKDYDRLVADAKRGEVPFR